MATNYSRGEGHEELCLKLAEMRKGSYRSVRDGCVVVLVECEECSSLYEEEFETARAKMIGGSSMSCLACDDSAGVPAFTGVTVQIGWLS